MTLGEKLLNLTVEYQEAQVGDPDGFPYSGRSSEDIAADYEATVLELVASRS